MNADYCVCCGGYVPEGRQVCHQCESKDVRRTKMYDEVCRTLTDYEHRDEPETQKEDWLDVFYRLLVRIQNSFECADF